ncbi:hypothetical protein ACH5RR_023151, partial [Cinchona calisaya]
MGKGDQDERGRLRRRKGRSRQGSRFANDGDVAWCENVEKSGGGEGTQGQLFGGEVRELWGGYALILLGGGDTAAENRIGIWI